MNLKKIGKALLFPPLPLALLLVPIAAAGLICSMLYLEDHNPVRIGSYLLSFYVLTILCARLPKGVAFFRNFRSNNRFFKVWTENIQLRTNVTLGANILWNSAYGALQLVLGIYHRSAWFYSLFAYYATLAAMRLFLVRRTLRHKPGEEPRQELIGYRACGWVFLLTNLALSGMMFYMICENRAVRHNEITTIMQAAYTFTALTLAIINVVRYRRFNSPAVSAAKAISLAAAGVSMLTLENTMLTTFSDGTMSPGTVRFFLGLSGGAVSALIISISVYMIVQANRKLKNTEAYQ